MGTIVDLKDKRRKWALFPVGSAGPAAPPTSSNQSESDDRIAPAQKKEALQQKTELVWQAQEYIYHPKSADWYWGVGLGALALLIIAILSGNFLFAIFTAVAGFTIALWGARKPKTISIKIDGNGIAIEERHYAYQELVSFWIHYDLPMVKEMSIMTKQTLLPSLRIPLGEENPAEIRAFLLRFLPERMEEESLIDIMARIVKF